MRLDVAWMGRETARNPITVKSARRIEHDAKWRGWKDRAKVAGLIAFFVAVIAATLAGFLT